MWLLCLLLLACMGAQVYLLLWAMAQSSCERSEDTRQPACLKLM